MCSDRNGHLVVIWYAGSGSLGGAGTVNVSIFFATIHATGYICTRKQVESGRAKLYTVKYVKIVKRENLLVEKIAIHEIIIILKTILKLSYRN
jgi:hypothetical protein